MSSNCSYKGKNVKDSAEFAKNNGYSPFSNFGYTKTNEYMKYFSYLHGITMEVYLNEFGKILDPSSFNDPSIYNDVRNNLMNSIRFDIENENSTATDETKEDLKNILANFDNFLKEYSKRISFNITEKLDDTDKDIVNKRDNDEEDDSKDEYQRASWEDHDNTDTAWDSSEIKVRNLFLTIPKMRWYKPSNSSTIEFIEEINESTGLPIMANPVGLFNSLADVFSTANVQNADEFFNLLYSEGLMKRFPEISYLQRLLPNPTRGSFNPTDYNTVSYMNTIVNSLVKARVNIYSVTKRDKGTSLQMQTKKTEDQIREKWVNNFELQGENEHIVVIDGVNYLKSIPKNIRSKDEELYFINLIGISLSNDAYSLMYKYMSQNESINNQITWIHKMLQLHFDINPGIPLKNPLNSIANASSDSPLRKAAQSVRDLAVLEGRTTGELASLTYFTAEGEMIQALMQKNTMSTIVSVINDVSTLEGLYQKLPYLRYNNFFNNGYFRDQIFDEGGNKKESFMIMGNYNGYSDKNHKKNSVSSKSMTYKEKLITDINAFGGSRNGVTDIPRTESSSSFYFIKPSNHYKLDRKESYGYIKKYLSAEINRIKKSTLRNGNSFFMFDKILSDESKEGLLSGELSVDNIEDELDKYFTSLAKGLLDRIKSYSLTKGDIAIAYDGDRVNPNFLRDFVRNYFINAAEFTFLTTGDPSYFKDFHKRIKTFVSTGIPFVQNSYTSIYLDDSYSDTLAYTINKKSKRRDNSKTYKTSIIKEFTNSDRLNADNKSKKIQDDLAKAGIELSDEEKKLFDDTYNNLKIADGQGYINMDFYREFMLTVGRWNDYMNDAYRYNIYFYKANKFTLPNGEIKKAEKLSEQEQAEYNKLSSLIFGKNSHLYTLPIIKAQYAGALANKDIKEHVSAMDKFSLAPLLPSIIHESDNLSKLMHLQIENQIGYSKMESAAKGYISHSNSVDELKNNDEHYSQFLKEQIKTNNEQKLKVSWSTQFRKLLFSRLFSEGKAISPRVEELKNEYVSLLQQIAQNKKYKLVEKLGIEYDGESVYIKDFTKFNEALKNAAISSGVADSIIDNMEVDEDGKLFIPYEESGIGEKANDVLFGMIDKELRLWKLPGNQYVQYSNAFYKELDFYSHNTETRSTNRAQCRVALSGEFLKLLNLTDNTGNRIGTIDRLNELLKDKKWRQEHKESLTIIAVRIPVQGHNSMEHLEIVQFLNPTGGNIIQLYDEVTGKSGSDFDIDKLTVFTPSLFDNGEYIKGDLSTLREKILSLEKEYTYLRDLSNEELYTVNEDGYDITASSSLINAIFDKISTVDVDIVSDAAAISLEKLSDLVNNYIDLRKRYDAYNTNRLNELYSEILSLPEVYKQLVTPNTTEAVSNVIIDVNKKINKDFQTTDPLPTKSDVFSYNANIDVFDKLMIGRRHLGRYATLNTIHEMSTMLGLKIKKNYDLDKGASARQKSNVYKKNFQDSLYSDEELDYITDKDGLIKLDVYKNMYGEDIQEYLNQSISITVDAAKDPNYKYSGINSKNLNFVAFMLKTGKKYSSILQILNIPPIKKFYEDWERIGFNTARSEAMRFIAEQESFGNTEQKMLDVTKWNGKVGGIINMANGIVSEANKSNRKALMDWAGSIILRKVMEQNRLAGDMNAFFFYNNFDTRKIRTPISVKLKKFQELDLIPNDELGSGAFTSSDVHNFTDKSIYSLFNNLNLQSSLSSKILPILSDEEFVSYAASMLYDKFRYNAAIRDSVEKKIQAHYIQAILQQFGSFQGQNIEDLTNLLMSKSYPKSLLAKMRYLKKTNEWKSLEKYDVIKNLRPEIRLDGDIVNFTVIRNNKKDKNEIDAYKEQFQKIIDSKLSDNMRQFLNELFTVFMRQGKYQSKFYNFDIIPQSFVNEILGKAVDRFNKSSTNQEWKTNFITSFVFNKFVEQNPKLFMQEDISGVTDYIKYYKQAQTITNPTTVRQVKDLQNDNNSKAIPLQNESSFKNENIVFEEDQTTGYRSRTIKNASADATIAIAVDFNSTGEKLTKSSVLNQGKLYLPVSTNIFSSSNEVNMMAEKIVSQIIKLGKNNITLNIAGNGLYSLKNTFPGGQKSVDNFTLELLTNIVNRLKENGVNISLLRTGGQTGFDEAGAKAGIKLGIPTKVLAPKGWAFRDINGKDIYDERQFKSRFDDKKHDIDNLPPKTCE